MKDLTTEPIGELLEVKWYLPCYLFQAFKRSPHGNEIETERNRKKWKEMETDLVSFPPLEIMGWDESTAE